MSMYEQNQLQPLAERDKELEALWAEFGDVPMDPDTERLEDNFLHFPAGTPREDVWHWFDERYSKGVYHLLYGYGGVDHTDQIAKLTYLNGLCDECTSEDCAFNHDCMCRYALVHEQKPTITEEDGCTSFVVTEVFPYV